jgi:hypothetical protein
MLAMKPFPRHTTPVLVAAVAAACLALGSTGGAVAGSLITGKQIKNSSVTGKDIKDGSLTAADLKPGTVVAGATGATGAAGTPGIAGKPGISGYQLVEAYADGVPANTDGPILSATCPAGKQLISATSFWFASNEAVVTVYYSAATGGPVNSADSYSDGIPAVDDLTLQLLCAVVAP